MQLLTLDQLLQLHALVLSRYGGGEGLRDLGRLEAAVASQHQVVFGQELYQTVFEKAAALVRGIVGDHLFTDGNKRTGLLAGLTFVELNGFAITAQKGELEDFAVSVATDRLDVTSIASWLEAHSQLSGAIIPPN